MASSSSANDLSQLSKPTVWHEFTPLANEHNAVNLGQGFPNWDPPAFVVKSMEETVNVKGTSTNQYCRPQCHLPLAQALADDYNSRPSWAAAGVSVDPASNVVSSLGVTQIMYIAFRSLIKPGDEVVLLEPAFDIYAPQVLLTGGSPRYVSMKTDTKAGDTANEVFQVDWDALEATVNSKTRVLVLNSPHNPTGKIFSRTELDRLAGIVAKYPNLIVFSDEVYERIVFDPEGSPHISFATIPGMWERTLTMSSAGKTFSATGWKCGWCVGPSSIIKLMADLQQWVNFSTPTVTQDAVARSLVKARSPFEGHPNFYAWLAADYLKRRDFLMRGLEEAGLPAIVPAGGFFICAETGGLKIPDEVFLEDSISAPDPMPRDYAVARYMTHTDPKVAVIPPSPFYSKENKGEAEGYVRFCFCKTDDLLQEGVERLKGMGTKE
ncbi:hypothetical protein TrRE_jg9140 [Triparma retinervis]|uniref:Aminotransferase class I/classII large domain-containing protein n=1 Tax=Triparma retinervis TaxID=2557542 RepID=A0A9W7KUP1_9STRA|nr:hypothetical protein TrRE_jg9140 [Triparma retinervis]